MKNNIVLIGLILIPVVGWAQKPVTSTGVIRPTTASVVSRPQTPAAQTVQVRPVSTAEVVQPFTTVEVSHPTTPATPENASVALVQPTKAAAPQPVAANGGKTGQSASMMSGYTPPKAKDFKAAGTSSVVSNGLVKSVENAPSNANLDAARKQQQELIQNGVSGAAPQVPSTNANSIGKSILNEISKSK